MQVIEEAHASEATESCGLDKHTKHEEMLVLQIQELQQQVQKLQESQSHWSKSRFYIWPILTFIAAMLLKVWAS